MSRLIIARSTDGVWLVVEDISNLPAEVSAIIHVGLLREAAERQAEKLNRLEQAAEHETIKRKIASLRN